MWRRNMAERGDRCRKDMVHFTDGMPMTKASIGNEYRPGVDEVYTRSNWWNQPKSDLPTGCELADGSTAINLTKADM
jgi:hypothetical protein